MNEFLRVLVDLRDRSIQKSRIAFGNRYKAIEQMRDQASPESVEITERWFRRFEELEKELDADIALMANDLPIIQHMVEVKGVGPMLAAKVACMIDIERAPTVSALWRYAGFAVIDGEREKPTKGEKLHYNNRLKASCRLVAESFLKSNSPYRKIYDDAREYYDANRPDWTKLHKHNAALRKMVKVWLAHLWDRWRELEGLPTRKLYVQEKLGHTGYFDPVEFGWLALAIKQE